MIKGIPTDIEIKETQTNIEKENPYLRISNIFRLKRKDSQIKKWAESQSICIEFLVQNLPEKVKIWKVNLFVSPYIPPLRRCFNCGKFGHISKGCNVTQPICLNCGVAHSLSKENMCKVSPKCINCSDSHHTLNRECPKLKINKAIVLLKSIRQWLLTIFLSWMPGNWFWKIVVKI